MKIIDWTRFLKVWKADPTKERFIMELIKSDFKKIRESILSGNKVIIRFYEGLRIEILFLNEIGQFDIKKVVKDFAKIREYNLQTQEMLELAESIRTKLNDDPEKLKEFDEWINSKLNHPLYEIKFILGNEVLRSISGIPYYLVETYLTGFLRGYQLEINPEKIGD